MQQYKQCELNIGGSEMLNNDLVLLDRMHNRREVI